MGGFLLVSIKRNGQQLPVSGPSRGLGGFLQEKKEEKKNDRSVSGPSRGLGGFLPCDFRVTKWLRRFPAPLEGWVVSYPISCIPKRESIHKIVPTWKLS